MSEIQSLTLRAQALTQSVDWWNTAVIWGLTIAAVAAVFVLVSTRVVVTKAKDLSKVQDRFSEAKDKQLAIDLKAKDEQIAAAKQGAAEATATAKGFESKISESDARAKAAEAQVASAVARSNEAVAQVKNADARIAEAQRDAARANETAERERLARLQLEARLADRVVTSDQQRRLKDAFSPLKGQTVDVVIIGDSLEITNVANAIIESISAAGVFINLARPFGGAYARGIIVGVRKDAASADKKACNLLILTLRETFGNGVGQDDFEKIEVMNITGTVGNTPGAGPMGQSPIRLIIAPK